MIAASSIFSDDAMSWAAPAVRLNRATDQPTNSGGDQERDHRSLANGFRERVNRVAILLLRLSGNLVEFPLRLGFRVSGKSSGSVLDPAPVHRLQTRCRSSCDLPFTRCAELNVPGSK